MAMSAKSLEVWAWVLIYAGLGLLSLGVFVRRTQGGLGLVMLLAGTAGALAGAALIYARSRLPDDPPIRKEKP